MSVFFERRWRRLRHIAALMGISLGMAWAQLGSDAAGLDGLAEAASAGSIAYARDDGSLYMVNADGSRPSQLWHGLQDPHALAWSPDGERLAVAADGNEGRCLYVLSLVDEQLATLACGYSGLWEPRWSPDGQHVAFYGRQAPAAPWRAWAAPAAGGPLVELAPNLLNVLTPAWLNAETVLVAGEEAGDTWRIYRVNLARPGLPEALTPPTACTPCACQPESALAIYPMLSRDGSQIAFVGGRTELSQDICTAFYALYLMSAAGGAPARITDLVDTSGGELVTVWLSRWAPVGQQVGVLAGGLSSGLQLKLVNTASGQAAALAGPAGGRWTGWDWSPDATQVVASYALPDGGLQVNVVDLSNGQSAQVAAGWSSVWRSAASQGGLLYLPVIEP